MATRNFDDVTIAKDTATEGTIKCTQKDFNPSNHTAKAELKGKDLVISAEVDGKSYSQEFCDVDIHPGIKCDKKKKFIEVKVIKNSNFSLRSKMD